jgi:hypothetical protein
MEEWKKSANNPLDVVSFFAHRISILPDSFQKQVQSQMLWRKDRSCLSPSAVRNPLNLT